MHTFDVDRATEWDFTIHLHEHVRETESPFTRNCDILYESIDLGEFGCGPDGQFTDTAREAACRAAATRLLLRQTLFVFGVEFDPTADLHALEQLYVEEIEDALPSRHEMMLLVGAYRAAYRKALRDPQWHADLDGGFSVYRMSDPKRQAALPPLPPGRVIGRPAASADTDGVSDATNRVASTVRAQEAACGPSDEDDELPEADRSLATVGHVGPQAGIEGDVPVTEPDHCICDQIAEGLDPDQHDLQAMAETRSRDGHFAMCPLHGRSSAGPGDDDSPAARHALAVEEAVGGGVGGGGG